jgi:hypothetical protein
MSSGDLSSTSLPEPLPCVTEDVVREIEFQIRPFHNYTREG